VNLISPKVVYTFTVSFNVGVQYRAHSVLLCTLNAAR